MKTAALLLGLIGLFGLTASADVINGDFETGDFTGWTTFGDLSFTGVSGSVCPQSTPTDCTPYDGRYSAFFGQVYGVGGIDQTIATDAGATYTLSYWFEVEPANFGISPANYTFSWNGTPFASATDPPHSGWTLLTFTGLLATGSTTDIQFATFNYPDWFGVDDVTVTESDTPEPVSIMLSGFGLLLAAATRARRSAARG